MPDIVESNFSVAAGLNTRVHPLNLGDQEAVELRNVDSTTPGQRDVRPDFTIVATGITAGPILALREFRKTTANAQVLLAVSPGASGRSQEALGVGRHGFGVLACRHVDGIHGESV